MLVFAAIVPHPPFLLPNVGKKRTVKLAATAKAYADLEKEFYVANPETIVIISPHGPILPDAFTVNLSADYVLDFKEFGDFETTRTFQSDFMLIDHIQRQIRKETPLTLASEQKVDYGIGIPLVFLTTHLEKIKVVPVTTAGLDLRAHFEFGLLLKEQIMDSNKRVAVVASADLAHTLTQDAPGGFSPDGQRLDETLIRLLKSKDTEALLSTDPELCAKNQACGVKPIATLLGAIDRVNYEFKQYSYEAPFGVGHLVANLQLS